MQAHAQIACKHKSESEYLLTRGKPPPDRRVIETLLSHYAALMAQTVVLLGLFQAQESIGEIRGACLTRGGHLVFACWWLIWLVNLYVSVSHGLIAQSWISCARHQEYCRGLAPDPEI